MKIRIPITQRLKRLTKWRLKRIRSQPLSPPFVKGENRPDVHPSSCYSRWERFPNRDYKSGWEAPPAGAISEPLRRRDGEDWGFRGFSP